MRLIVSNLKKITQSNTGAIKYLIVTQVSEKINSLTAHACVTQKKKKKLSIEIHTPIIFVSEHLQKPQQNYLPVQNAICTNSIVLHILHVLVFNKISNHCN